MSTVPARPSAPTIRDWSWRSRAVRGLVYQIIAVAVLIAVGWTLVANTRANMDARGIQSGFDFLTSPAGFDIGEKLIPYEPENSYWRAFLVGLSNTLRVALVGIVLTTFLGVTIGVGRLSQNWVIRKLCLCYVELFRNVPLLVQLFLWYFALTELLPSVDQAINPLPDVYLNQAGLQYPIPVWAFGHFTALIGLVVGIVASIAWRRAATKHREKTGEQRPVTWVVVALLIVTTLLGWAFGGAPTAMEYPEVGTFNVSGGGAVTPEFLTIVIGLSIYTASFVAEIVRGGIQSVSIGQTEASSALGLTRARALRLVVLPQAMRVIIPPMTNQYLNLTKNSSLAVAVGYPDLVSISNTSLNQTGRAVECIAIVMAVYLFLSLTTAWIMNLYNRKVAIKER
ncbi:amino acid ABC transporter permease [soil metagenome]